MNKKYLLFSLAILPLIGLGYAEEGKCEYNVWNVNQFTKCYLPLIYDQNEQIIEKLDWNNCAISYKDTWQYEYYRSGPSIWDTEITATNFKELVEFCGEMP